MYALLTTIVKECLILIKDKAGVGVILLMPVALLLVMTLVQQSAWEISSQAEIRVLYLDEDKGPLGEGIWKALDRMKIFRLEAAEPGTTGPQVAAAVAEGKVKVGIVIPPSTSESAHNRAMSLASAWVSGGHAAGGAGEGPPPEEVVVYADPLLQPAFRSALMSSLRLFLAGLERDILLKALSDRIGSEVEKGRPGPGAGVEGPKETGENRLVALREGAPRMGNSRLIPNAVQHNVPAWTLFGMFFIVVPLSGSMINERTLGVWARVLTTPASPFFLMAGKIVFYLCVCLVQMGLMLLLGVFVLPLLGLPALQLGTSGLTVVMVGISSGLAAVGFGLLVGSLWSRQAPAAMFGAIFVVIMAALGGLMVPVFLMPRVLRAISVFSPLGWGLDAFHDVFARGAGLRQVAPDVLLLLAFFTAATAVSVLVLKRRTQQ